LKTGASLVLEAAVEVRRWPKLGMPLALRFDEGAMDERLEAILSGTGLEAARGLLE